MTKDDPSRREAVGEQGGEECHEQGGCSPEDAVDPFVSLLRQAPQTGVCEVVHLSDTLAEPWRLDESVGIDQKRVHFASGRTEVADRPGILRDVERPLRGSSSD